MAYASDIPLLHAISEEAATFVGRAIIFSMAGIFALVGFILVRRTVRRRYFDRLASAEFYVRQHWEEILSGEIPADDWRTVRDDAEAIITMTLDRLDLAEGIETAKLQIFLRGAGLLDRIALDALRLRGWRREAALVRLGRTRAPEAVPLLVRALDDPHPATQLAAVRGLARTGLATAAEAMLERVVTGELALAGTSLLNALMICTRGNPRILLPYLYLAQGGVRELLARVMAETASVALGDDLLLLAYDQSPEVRASVRVHWHMRNSASHSRLSIAWLPITNGSFGCAPLAAWANSVSHAPCRRCCAAFATAAGTCGNGPPRRLRRCPIPPTCCGKSSPRRTPMRCKL